MANIQKRISQDGETAYRVRVRMKGYPVQTATFPRLTDARKWVQQTEVAIRQGRHFPSCGSQAPHRGGSNRPVRAGASCLRSLNPRAG